MNSTRVTSSAPVKRTTWPAYAPQKSFNYSYPTTEVDEGNEKQARGPPIELRGENPHGPSAPRGASIIEG
jgi:hypothetical protein